MNRITQKLQALAARKEKALTCFLTAGYPSLDATVPYVVEFAKSGADIIELGMPFSDPLADGPVIQHSSQIALQQGMTLEGILTHVKLIRESTDIPLVLMGYCNAILSYGVEKFFQSAARAGVDGLILPEITYEESERYKALFERMGLAQILLVTPTTTRERIALIDRASSGFLYCVSTTGVTGSTNRARHLGYIDAVKRSVKKNPILVGFGIKAPDDAHRLSRNADGIIVGSELIRRITRGDSQQDICSWIRQLKEAL